MKSAIGDILKGTVSTLLAILVSSVVATIGTDGGFMRMLGGVSSDEFIELQTKIAEREGGGMDYGDDTSLWANDNECDDIPVSRTIPKSRVTVWV